jgi:hypothetical protein
MIKRGVVFLLICLMFVNVAIAQDNNPDGNDSLVNDSFAGQAEFKSVGSGFIGRVVEEIGNSTDEVVNIVEENTADGKSVVPSAKGLTEGIEEKIEEEVNDEENLRFFNWMVVLFSWVVAPLVFVWFVQVFIAHFVRSFDSDGEQGWFEKWLVRLVSHSKVSFVLLFVIYFLIVVPSGLFRFIESFGDYLFYDVSYVIAKGYFSGASLVYFPFVFFGVMAFVLTFAYSLFSFLKFRAMHKEGIKKEDGEDVEFKDVLLKRTWNVDLKVDKGKAVVGKKVLGKDNEMILEKKSKKVMNKKNEWKGDKKGKQVLDSDTADKKSAVSLAEESTEDDELKIGKKKIKKTKKK